jgi:hypothetical protein
MFFQLDLGTDFSRCWKLTLDVETQVKKDQETLDQTGYFWIKKKMTTSLLLRLKRSELASIQKICVSKESLGR